MVLINGKEYTEEQLANLVGDLKVAQDTLKKQSATLKEKQSLEEQLKELDSIKTKNADLQAEIFKTKMNERTKQLSKFLESKDQDTRQAIMAKIGNMDDDDFDFFKEGKTDTELSQRDEINNEKQTLEEKQKDFEKRKADIIKEEASKLQNDKQINSLLPKDAIDQDQFSETGNEDRLADGLFPNIDSTKEMYHLDKNPLYSKRYKEYHESNAEAYLSTNYDREFVI